MNRALLLLPAMWILFALNSFSPVDLTFLGTFPRHLSGTFGIFFTPLLHKNFYHLLGNSVCLLMIFTIIFSSIEDGERIDAVFARIFMISGILLWLCGRSVSENGLPLFHIGASNVAYGLLTFAFVYSIWNRLPIMCISSVLVALFGGQFFQGLWPNSEISWDGHWLGSIAGIIVANIDYQENIHKEIFHD